MDYVPDCFGYDGAIHSGKPLILFYVLPLGRLRKGRPKGLSTS